MKSRTQKAALNTTTAAISEFVSLVCGLILPRLILVTFGSTYNGITSSAKQFLSAVSILTVGIAGATRIALYRPLAEKDVKKTSGIVRATEKYMQKVGIVFTVYLAVLIIVYPLVVDTGYSWIEVAPLILAAGISAAGRYFWGTPYNALISADQCTYVYNICIIATNIGNVILSVCLIKLECSIQVVKLGSSLILALNPIIRSIYVRRKYRLIRKCEPDNSALSTRRDVIGHSVANIIHDHTDIVVLTAFCNVKIVSVYTVYNLIMNALKKTERVFTSGTEAVFGNMWVKGELDKIKLNLGYYEYILAAFISIVFSTTLIMILPFISIYTKGVHDVDYILPAYAVVITTAQMFFSFRTPYVALVQGVGHYKQTKNGAYAEALINLSTSIILVQFVGIVGVAIGTLIANVFRTFQYAIYIDNHIVKRGKDVFIKRILWAACNIIAIYFMASGVAGMYAYKGWWFWIITAVVVTLFSALVTLVSTLVFCGNDLRGVIGMIRRSFKRKRKKQLS